MYVYHGGFQKYNRKVDIYEYHHISLMFVSIQLLCIGKFYAFCIARANLTLQGCWKRGSGPPVFGRTANQREQIMPTKLLLPPHPDFWIFHRFCLPHTNALDYNFLWISHGISCLHIFILKKNAIYKFQIRTRKLQICTRETILFSKYSVLYKSMEKHGLHKSPCGYAFDTCLYLSLDR